MIQEYFKGITAYLKAFRTISSMRLWSFMLAPALISLLLAGLIFGTAWGISDNIGEWLISWYPWEFGKDFLLGLSNWVGGLSVAAIGLILFKHLVLVFISPFMSPLSQKIEENMLGKQGMYKGFQFSKAIKDILRGLRLALRNIFREVFFNLLLIIAGLIFPPIAIFTTVAIFLVQAYYAGFGNMDYTLERHHNVSGSARFVRRHRMLALGNGTVFMGLLFTGVGILIAPPLSAVAATLETIPRLELPQLEESSDSNYV